MIIKVKKRDLLLAISGLILIILIPYIYSADEIDARVSNFGVWVIITNQAPNVTIGNFTLFSVDPLASGDSVIVIFFNASDPNGPEDINGTNGGAVIVNFTLGAPSIAQFRVGSETCSNTTNSVGVVTFNCTVTMRYYDNASANWVINVTVTDSGGLSYTNDTATFTYNQLSSFAITVDQVSEGSNLNFSSLNVDQTGQQAKRPILLNNTGNDDFNQINITGADLAEVGGSGTLTIGNFFVNVTNSSTGKGLPLTTGPLTIPATQGSGLPNATLLHGPAGLGGEVPPYLGATDFLTRGNLSLYFFVDIPAGTTSATYNGTWNITVVDVN